MGMLLINVIIERNNDLLILKMQIWIRKRRSIATKSIATKSIKNIAEELRKQVKPKKVALNRKLNLTKLSTAWI